ncbi:MAG: hypothetical protein A2X49_11515 [Lentisphaerae bacterium GWF2_52_8]|nr:MAG: hypothetical protein A2X49_11515 [Lentisphaerae bacterium GWF2_52_8]
MFKKLLILIVVGGLVGMAFLQVITTNMAESAFASPDSPSSQDSLKNAIQWKMYMYMYSQARPIAERAIITFPESRNIDFYIYSAALCGDREKLPEVAIHWYERFVQLFPDHQWTRQAQNNLNKLKALNDK